MALSAEQQAWLDKWVAEQMAGEKARAAALVKYRQWYRARLAVKQAAANALPEFEQNNPQPDTGGFVFTPEELA